MSGYVFEINLVGSKENISRVFKVPSNISLDMMHCVIQLSLGLEVRHSYGFVFDDKVATPYKDINSDPKKINSSIVNNMEQFSFIMRNDKPSINTNVTLADLDVSKKNTKFMYEYGVEYNWQYEVNFIDETQVDSCELLCVIGYAPPEMDEPYNVMQFNDLIEKEEKSAYFDVFSKCGYRMKDEQYMMCSVEHVDVVYMLNQDKIKGTHSNFRKIMTELGKITKSSSLWDVYTEKAFVDEWMHNLEEYELSGKW